MLLAKVNYLCGVSSGVRERHFSSGLESQLHFKKLSRVLYPLAPRFHNFPKLSEKQSKTSEELYIKNTRSSSLTQHSVWHTRRHSYFCSERGRHEQMCSRTLVLTIHLSHWSENRSAFVKQLENSFQSCEPLMTEDARCEAFFLPCAFPIEITQLWFIKTVI